MLILKNLDKKGRFDLIELSPKSASGESWYGNGLKPAQGVYNGTLAKQNDIISDFEPVGDDKILFLWTSGKLTIWSYGQRGNEIVSTYDLRNQIGFDNSILYNTLSVSFDKTRAVVSSCEKATSSGVGLHLISLENTGFIEYKSSVSLNNQTESQGYNSRIQNINFHT